MKKRNIIKFFSLTISLSILFSTIVSAKNIHTTKIARQSVYCVDPHPNETGVPMD